MVAVAEDYSTKRTMSLIRLIKKGAGMDLIDDSPVSTKENRKSGIKTEKIVKSSFKDQDKFLMGLEQELQRSIEKLQKASEAIRVRRGFNSK